MYKRQEQSCSLVISGKVETNITSLEALCKDFKNIPEKEFFLKLILSSKEENKGLENKALSSLEKISKIMHNKLILAILIGIFAMLGYLLSEETNDFISHIGKSLFRVGLLIILSYALLSIYAHYAAIDTSAIFEAFVGEAAAVPSTIINIVPIMFLRIFKLWVIILAVVFIAINIAIKHFVYSPEDLE